MKTGDIIKLNRQEVTVIECEHCGALMVNLDQKDLFPGDLYTLRAAGVRISNPSTKDAICIDCEIRREDIEHTFKRRVSDYYKAPSHHDDSSFFGGGSFGGGGGGGFGGFGGGGFSGGGASGGW